MQADTETGRQGDVDSHGVTMKRKLFKTIPLTFGQRVMVDASDYQYLSQWKWYAKWNSHTHSYYAGRNQKIPKKRRNIHFSMSRVILGLERGDQRHAEHKNGNTLDNRRENLRFATPSQNAANKKLIVTNTSGFRGVTQVASGRYKAQIGIRGKRFALGIRDTAEAAYRELYVPAARKAFGEFARV